LNIEIKEVNEDKEVKEVKEIAKENSKETHTPSFQLTAEILENWEVCKKFT